MYFVFINDTISTTMWVLQVYHVQAHSFQATHRRSGSHQENCFVHTATVPVCPCSVCFFLFLARCPTNSVSSGLGAASRPDSSCTDQMALLPGHSSLFADLDWPNLFVCRPSSSAAWPHLIGLAGGAKVHNGNTQRHFRVVRDACVR